MDRPSGRCVIRLGADAGAGAGAGASASTDADRIPLNRRPMGERVREGMRIEQRILQQLRESGMHLTAPTHTEDAYAKVDAWWHTTDVSNGPVVQKGIQVKYRETGDDILFEVYKDWTRKIPGRDLIGTADYYMTVDRTGRGYLVCVEELKGKVHAALASIDQHGWTDSERSHFVDRAAGIDIKIRADAYHGQQKCIAYVRPRSLHIVQEWAHLL